jgi:glycosyltransferase involved in cell wall biosynthesis
LQTKNKIRNHIPLSVIICSHNPDIKKIQHVLKGLEKQSLKINKWELLVIDNCSSIPIKKRVSISWHSESKIIEEKKPGLTSARLRGIKESRGEILVFVDDDNVLQKDYLVNVIKIFRRHPELGVVGGKYIPKYEIPVPEHAKPYVRLLCVSEKPFKDSLSLSTKSFPDIAGAGMALRRSCALIYKKELKKNRLGLLSDRRQNSLISGGDTHICLCALKNGFGVGKFNCLVLAHLIGKERLRKAYLLKIQRDMAYSHHLVNQINGLKNPFKILEYAHGFLSSFTKKPFDGAMRRAAIFGSLRFWIHKLQGSYRTKKTF